MTGLAAVEVEGARGEGALCGGGIICLVLSSIMRCEGNLRITGEGILEAWVREGRLEAQTPDYDITLFEHPSISWAICILDCRSRDARRQARTS